MKTTHVLTLFTYQMCHSRIEGTALVKDALREMEGVLFNEKDLVADANEAKFAGARLSPTIVLDGKILCVGLPSKAEIRKMIKERVGQ